MSTTETNVAISTVDVSERAGLSCAACPHPWEAHDRIGRRYCTATAVGAFNRGCVCVGDTSVGDTSNDDATNPAPPS